MLCNLKKKCNFATEKRDLVTFSKFLRFAKGIKPFLSRTRNYLYNIFVEVSVHHYKKKRR